MPSDGVDAPLLGGEDLQPLLYEPPSCFANAVRSVVGLALLAAPAVGEAPLPPSPPARAALPRLRTPRQTTPRAHRLGLSPIACATHHARRIAAVQRPSASAPAHRRALRPRLVRRRAGWSRRAPHRDARGGDLREGSGRSPRQRSGQRPQIRARGAHARRAPGRRRKFHGKVAHLATGEQRRQVCPPGQTDWAPVSLAPPVPVDPSQYSAMSDFFVRENGDKLFYTRVRP